MCRSWGNGRMAKDAGAEGEVLQGHLPRPGRRPGMWLAVPAALLLVVTVGAVAAAVHYRAAVRTVRPTTSSRPSRSQAPDAAERVPELWAVSDTRLPVAAGEAARVQVIHSSDGNGNPRSVVIAAQLSGLRPDHHYRLVGGSCQGNGSDLVWAAGSADSGGSLLLITAPRLINPDANYWLMLDQPRVRLLAGLSGDLANGDMTAFEAGHAPCTP
jgi:hypothetical protein